MNNNNIKVDLTQETPLKDKVAGFKLVAREALRMQLISPRLTKITGYESEIKRLDKDLEKLNHKITVKEYEIENSLDQNHPDFEVKKKRAEEEIKDLKETIKDVEEEKKNIQEAIDHQLEGIILIETGETKVSRELLNNLVNELIVEDAKKTIRE